MAASPVGAPTSLVLRAAGLLLLAILARFFFVLYQKRTYFRRIVRTSGVDPLPGHSWLFGHLVSVGTLMTKYPPDTAGQMMPFVVCEEYPHLAKAGAFYIDLWPLSHQMLTVYTPDMMAQFCQERSQPKHQLVRDQFQPFSGNKDLATSDGPAWKMWRSIFNPGFSAQNIMSLVPVFVEEILVFKKYLHDVAASGEVVQLENHAIKATCDVISRSVLGTSLGCQAGKSPAFDSLKANLGWLIPEWSPRNWPRLLNPFRHPMLAYHNYVMRRELSPIIESQLHNLDRTEGPKTINSLAMRAYVKGAAEGGGKNAQPSRSIDPAFLDTTLEHMKIFLFAGHDTTATALCFTYNFLHRNPHALTRLRAEHDAVLGADVTQAAKQLTANPSLLNQLPYTNAVIKETLRLQPPVGTVRDGAPDLSLRNNETGHVFPTDKFLLFGCSHTMQRHADYWPDPQAYRPERWITEQPGPNGTVEVVPAQTRKNAWRPFELGPRSCIGQEVALTELRIILAVTIRELDIVPAYEAGAPTIFGDEAYQCFMPSEITPHVKGGFPVRVHLRKTESS